jgi:hypothetical protein
MGFSEKQELSQQILYRNFSRVSRTPADIMVKTDYEKFSPIPTKNKGEACWEGHKRQLWFMLIF